MSTLAGPQGTTSAQREFYRVDLQFADVAPPWFQGAIQQLRADLKNMIRAEITPDLKRVYSLFLAFLDIADFQLL